MTPDQLDAGRSPLEYAGGALLAVVLLVALVALCALLAHLAGRLFDRLLEAEDRGRETGPALDVVDPGPLVFPATGNTAKRSRP